MRQTFTNRHYGFGYTYNYAGGRSLIKCYLTDGAVVVIIDETRLSGYVNIIIIVLNSYNSIT